MEKAQGQFLDCKEDSIFSTRTVVTFLHSEHVTGLNGRTPAAEFVYKWR